MDTTVETIPYNIYCFLCSKKFASKRNLKIHEERLHQVCKKPTFICSHCNTGFEDYIMFQDHHSARLKRTLSKKTKKRQDEADKLLIVKKIKKETEESSAQLKSSFINKEEEEEEEEEEEKNKQIEE